MTICEMVAREIIRGADNDKDLRCLDGLREVYMTFEDDISLHQAAEEMIDMVNREYPNKLFERFTCESVYA